MQYDPNKHYVMSDIVKKFTPHKSNVYYRFQRNQVKFVGVVNGTAKKFWNKQDVDNCFADRSPTKRKPHTKKSKVITYELTTPLSTTTETAATMSALFKAAVKEYLAERLGL